MLKLRFLLFSKSVDCEFSTEVIKFRFPFTDNELLSVSTLKLAN